MKYSYTDEAISLAVQGRWEEAVAINESIIEISPNDVNAYNRLGKALTELGHYAEARKAYERVLDLSPNNNIAKRNLQRLSYLKDGERTLKEARGINFRFFIEETSKARMVNLYGIASRERLAKMSAGDQVYLQIRGQRLVGVNDSGEYLGEIEPRIGLRLIELIEGGNEYKVAIISLRDDRIRVIIRETFQHPSQIGHPSFPPRAVEELRPYLKDTLFKYDLDDEFFEEAEEPGEWDGEAEPLLPDDIPPEDEVSAFAQEDVDKVA